MIITRTPLRISFTGGGTDFKGYYAHNGGAVVSASIDKHIYITVNPKFDHKLRVSYSKTEIVDKVEELHHEIIKAALNLIGIRHGIEITSIADIPSGTGLGSSSTFTVGVLNALHVYIGKILSPEELAQMACEVEINILKHPIGKQDQYAAAYGGINYFKFNPDDSVERKQVILDAQNLRKIKRKLMFFYTGITRSADNILQEQKDNIESRLAILDSMRDEAGTMYETLTHEGFNEKFADMLNHGWESKQKLAGQITNPEISEYYSRAINAGAKGGKLLGAGGGGFLLFYCDEQFQQNVEDAIGLRRVDFDLSFNGSRVVFMN